VLWFLIRIYTAWADPSTMFPCDPVDGDKIQWTRDQRQGARELALEHLKAKGAKPVFLAFVDSATIRESSGAPSRWHDDGTGLGLHGLNTKYHAKGRNLCDPRASADAVQELARRCISKHGHGHGLVAWDLQACYAGRFECLGLRTEGCTQAMMDRTTEAICGRLAKRGFDCYAPIRESDLGR